MIKAHIEALVMGAMPGASIVILRPMPEDRQSDCVVPICIGLVEAAAIAKAINHERTARPMTHSLVGNIVTQLGGRVVKVSIDKVRGTIFYATIHIQRGDTINKVDARPSDALAIAVRLNAPIYIDESVVASASYPIWVNMTQEQQDAEIEEFHTFVESLSPSDFVTGGITGE